MRWVKASAWFSQLTVDERGVLQDHAFPINDPLVPFMDDDSQIIMVRGGRGGGKSNTIALRLIEECRTSEYFKCYFGRKVLDRVRGTQHAELIKAIKPLKLEHEFSYSENPNGSLVIVHKETLNSFLPFGADNADSMKGISDPTHMWCDEFDQFTDSDFRALFPTLRTSRGKNIFIGSFNSYEVLRGHWLVRYFFPEVYEGTEKMDFDILKGVRISRYLINYRDNYFIDQAEYEKTLRLSAGGDADLFEGLANGEWGLDKKGDLWYHAFKKGLHVKKVEYLPELPDHLVFDFNLVPYMTCLVVQIKETETEFQIRIPKEYCLKHPRNTTEALCYAYLNDFEDTVTDIYFYGDAMGNRGVEGFGDTFTRFDPVKAVLFKYLFDYSDRTTRVNKPVNKRRNLINGIFSGLKYYGDKKVVILIDEECYELIKDMQNTKEGVNGKLKEKEKDPVNGRTWEKYGHTGDCLEYVTCEILDVLL